MSRNRTAELTNLLDFVVVPVAEAELVSETAVELQSQAVPVVVVELQSQAVPVVVELQLQVVPVVVELQPKVVAAQLFFVERHVGQLFEKLQYVDEGFEEHSQIVDNGLQEQRHWVAYII
jgi:hypothetical protein